MTAPLTYTLAVTENGKTLDAREIEDPFITTTIEPSGWSVLWAVLRKRYKIVVRVNAPRILVEAVMSIDRELLAADQERRLAERPVRASDSHEINTASA